MIGFDLVLKLAQRDTDIREHILLLYFLPVVSDAKTVVEIGAGQSTFALLAAVNNTEGELYTHDFLKEAAFRGFPEGEKLLQKEDRYHFVPGNNLESVKLWNKPIDFLFIDAEHTYEETKMELNLWSKWVKKGGIITLHDTHIAWADCRRAVDEFLEEHQDEYAVNHMSNQNGFSILIKH